ncbi:glycosyltransferase family 2 protein [Xanthomonas massiliensis]|jgi:GT2 family glycosyltransferase|uniref:glycosyltransferase family 2 protein n=1 Tax=Xanthomonas massiliensis TaxID=1720302 RepID=UPI0008255311|nr:glycosyltransferase [Xanthomonas massiliensis]
MSPRIAIAIATAGRRDILSDTVRFVARQQRRADELLICPAGAQDIDPACLAGYPGESRVVLGPVGLPAQRNMLLARTDADIVVFLDDDFLPAPDYLAEVEALFDARPRTVVATGHVVADGILGPGIDFAEGHRLIEALGENAAPAQPLPEYGAYGCNMVVRMAPVRAHALRFDEALPLYAWLEDIDFSRQLARHGEIVRSLRLRGVHLGTKKAGRSPGLRLGYSQIANPVYLARKGTLSWKRALGQMSRNLLANGVRSLRPEPWVDRKGRLRGNLTALAHLAGGGLHPRRVLDFA